MEKPDMEISLRERVRQQILDLIHRMDLSYSTRLLSEEQMAAKFQVSRSTVRAVLSDLEIEGKVIRKQGSGTYVNVRTIHVDTTLYPRIDLRSIIINNGYAARSKVRAFTLLEILNYDEENRPVLLGNIYADTEMIRLNLIRDLS